MKPNLFIIGAPKCGTSALAQYISEHEQAFITDPKEPFYFSEDYPDLKRQNFLTDDASYLKLYAAADPRKHKVVGEGSTNYLASNIAIKNALRMSPDAKFISLLRNPVDVAHAFHMEQFFARNENEADFEKAWRLQDSRRSGEHIPDTCRAVQFLLYGDVAMYADQVERFFDLVPENQRLLILQEDMRNDTKFIYEQVLTFLELDQDGRTNFTSVNSSHAHRFEWLSNIILTPPKPIHPIVWGVRNYLRRTKPAPIEKLKSYLRVKSDRQEISPDLRQELAAFFREDILRLEKITGRNLNSWL